MLIRWTQTMLRVALSFCGSSYRNSGWCAGKQIAQPKSSPTHLFHGPFCITAMDEEEEVG